MTASTAVWTSVTRAAYESLTETEVDELNQYIAGWFASANPVGFKMAVDTWKAGRR